MTIKEFYENIGGSYQEAIGRMINDTLIYRLLNKFADTQNIDNILIAYKNQNKKELFELTHALKGVSSNLCITNVSKVVSVICDACRNQDDDKLDNLDNEIKELEINFKKVIDLIKQISL